MTDRDKKLIRNSTPEFLIFTGNIGKLTACHANNREPNAALIPVILERVFSEST